MNLISDMIGIPRADHAQLKEWCDQWVALLVVPLPEEQQLVAADAVVAYDAYCRSLLEARSVEPRSDIASHLADAVRQGSCTPREAVAIMRFLLFAGHASTMNLIAHTLHGLLRDRGQWELVVAEPERIVSAVEEGLRYESPIQGMTRQTTADVEMGGVVIPAGARVHVVVGAVARDPRRVPDPDTFDITRDTQGHHMAFGLGPHFCLGAGLARLTAKVALERLARRLPSLHLADGFEPEYMEGGYIFRGLTSLPTAWDTAADRDSAAARVASGRLRTGRDDSQPPRTAGIGREES
jgi:cytochrome P450